MKKSCYGEVMFSKDDFSNFCNNYDIVVET